MNLLKSALLGCGVLPGTCKVASAALLAGTTVYVGRHFEVRDHEQATKYVFNGDTRVAAVTGSLSTNKRVQRLRVFPGWNLCSLAVAGPFPASGAAAITACYQWNPQTRNYAPIVLGQSLPAETVLWVKASIHAVLTVFGDYSDPGARQTDAGGTYVSGTGLEAWSPVLPDSVSSWAFDNSAAQWTAQLGGMLGSAPPAPSELAPGAAAFVNASTPISLGTPDPALRIRYYHQDHLGSSSVITDSRGVLTEELAYHPFGATRNEFETSSTEVPYDFGQKERDHESHLHYFEARYLLGSAARFISADKAYASPERLPAKKQRALLLQPQLFNLYSYALNSPLRFEDPTGLEPVKLNWIQMMTVMEAQQEALSMLDDAIAQVNRDVGACAPNNAADAMLEKWFGFNNGLGNKKEIAGNLQKIRKQIARLKPENFRYEPNPTGDDAKAIAWVYRNDPKTVYLTSKFFDLDSSGWDSQAGTLIHENSHPTAVLGTRDLAYGQDDASALATEDKGKAQRNADNYEYFNESLPLEKEQRFINEGVRYFDDLRAGRCSK